MLARIVISCHNTNNEGHVQMDVSKLAQGNYVLVYNINNELITTTIIEIVKS